MTGNKKDFSSELLAACGMNCGVCMVFVREKNACGGCRSGNETRKSCMNCQIRNCKQLANTENGFCYECTVFPCSYLKKLDKRYLTNYRISLIENLHHIQSYGIKSFLESERNKHTCPVCRKLISIHWKECLHCSYKTSFVK